MSIVTQSSKDCRLQCGTSFACDTLRCKVDANVHLSVQFKENRMKDAKSLMSVMMLSMIACTGDKLEETQFRELFPTLTLTTESVDFETVVLYTDTQEFQIINSGFIMELFASQVRLLIVELRLSKGKLFMQEH